MKMNILLQELILFGSFLYFAKASDLVLAESAGKYNESCNDIGISGGSNSGWQLYGSCPDNNGHYFTTPIIDLDQCIVNNHGNLIVSRMHGKHTI